MVKVPIKAVIFDLDGTVADTQWLHGEIEMEILEDFGIHKSPEELTERFAGVSLQETFRAIFNEMHMRIPDLDALSKRKLAMLHARRRDFRPMPGIFRLTDMLRERKLPLAIASASRLITIELVLSTLHIRDRFEAIASTKEVSRGKPAPDVFLLAAERLRVASRHCLVIGDGAADIQGARAAGMRCIALWKHRPRWLPAELVVDNLYKIPDEFFDT